MQIGNAAFFSKLDMSLFCSEIALHFNLLDSNYLQIRITYLHTNAYRKFGVVAARTWICSSRILLNEMDLKSAIKE